MPVLTTAEECAAGVQELRGEYLALLDGVSGATWLRPTRLPGWSVQDVLSHVTGGVAMMMGEPLPDHTPPDAQHIRNDAGKFMEIAVDYRRAQSGDAVRDEYAKKSDAFVALLNAGLDMSEMMTGPFNSQLPRGPFLQIAMFDWWIHEQDLRDALGEPGRTSGVSSNHARGRIVAGLQHHIPAHVPEIAARGVAVVIDGNSVVMGDFTGEVALSLDMSLLTATALVAGRGDQEQARKDVTIRGDDADAAAVLDAINFVP